MRVRVAIDGLDHLGRQLLRTVVDRADPDFQIVVVRDDAPAAFLAERLRHDSIHGSWSRPVEVVGEHFDVGDGTIRVLHEANPRWVGADVEVVVSTDPTLEPRFLLAHGVRAVIAAGPAAREADTDATVVVGVNEDIYDTARQHALSASSPAAICTAALLRPLDRAFGVVAAAATSIEGRTAPVAAPDDPHLLRDPAVNLVPTVTGLGTELVELLPEFAGRLSDSALRVPVVDTALVELTALLPGPVTVGQVQRVLRSAAESPLKGLMSCTAGPAVSRDAVGAAESCRADLDLVRVAGDLVTVFGWYDPISGHAHRVADLLGLVARLLPRD